MQNGFFPFKGEREIKLYYNPILHTKLLTAALLKPCFPHFRRKKSPASSGTRRRRLPRRRPTCPPCTPQRTRNNPWSRFVLGRISGSAGLIRPDIRSSPTVHLTEGKKNILPFSHSTIHSLVEEEIETCLATAGRPS